MTLEELLPGLLDPNPCFICQDLNVKKGTERYRVPLVHGSVSHTHDEQADAVSAAAVLNALPDHPAIQQLRGLFPNGLGLGLWAPRLLVEALRIEELDDHELQSLQGSLMIFPPQAWPELRDQLRDWCEGEFNPFDDLSYTIDDTIPFAGPNFSPDRWYSIVKGPMTGNVCWWSHDDDCVMDAPWAVDVRAWGQRVFAETPDVLGGIISFPAAASIDAAPQNAELYPVSYMADMDSAQI